MATAVAGRAREQPLRPKHLADGDLAGEIGDQAKAFGIPVQRVDTWSPAAFMEAAAESAAAVQPGAGAVFLRKRGTRCTPQSGRYEGSLI